MSTNYPSMTTPATAPDFGGNKTINSEKTLLPPGLQPAVIFAVVDLGTHMESFNGKPEEPRRKIMIGFEFPQLKQRYYLEDEKPRSCMITKESTFIISDRSFLKALICGIYGRNLSDQECRTFDIMQILNMKVLANIIHTPISSGKNAGKIKESIVSVSSLGAYPLPVGFEPELPLQSFYIDPQGNNFVTSNYANLLPWIKNKVLASQEAQLRKSQNLPFARSQEEIEKESNGATQNQQTGYQTQTGYQQAGTPTPNQIPQPTPAPLPPSGKKVTMLNNQNYDAYIASGWTDELLVQNGYAVWNQTPNQTPPPPQVPSVPTPQPPQVPSAQTPPILNPGTGVGNPFIDGDEDDDLPF